MGRVNALKAKVLATLERYPETRNDDVVLTLQIWKSYYYQRIITGQNGHQYIDLAAVRDLPREDHVKRVRAVIQNEERKFLPITVEVAIKRGMSEEEWRRALGYNPEMRQPYYHTD